LASKVLGLNKEEGMWLFDTIANLFRSKKPRPHLTSFTGRIQGSGWVKQVACEHGTTEHLLTVMVLGVKCELRSSPMCVKCTEDYLHKHSTLCAICKQPIYPGKPIGYGLGGKADHAFAHSSCTGSAMYCGQWGEGQPVYMKEAQAPV